MKRLFSLYLTLIAGFALLYAAPVKFAGCVPADGSEISSFNFTLNFDISDAIAGLQDGTWGLGWNSSQSTILYEGTPTGGKEIGKALTNSVSGNSELCIPNATSVTISFPQFFPQPGKTYTLVVSNSFGLREIGVSGINKWLNDSKLNLSDNPIVITFTGRAPADNELLLFSSSVKNGVTLEKLNKIDFTFNNPISVKPGLRLAVAKVNPQLVSGLDTVAMSSNAYSLPDNNKVLRVEFADEVQLLHGKTFKITLPEGAVSLSAYPDIQNTPFTLEIKGDFYYRYPVKSSDIGDHIFPGNITVSYDLPEGYKFKSGTAPNIYIYKGNISEDNLVRKAIGSGTLNYVLYNLESLKLEPETDYYYVIPKNSITYLLGANDTQTTDWRNDEFIYHLKTPPVGTPLVPTLEFDRPLIGKYESGATPYQKDMALSDLTDLEIPLKGKTYTFENAERSLTGELYRIREGVNLIYSPMARIYEITQEGETLLYEVFINGRKAADGTQLMILTQCNVPLYEGHKYKLVIPEKSVCPDLASLSNYVWNPEFVFYFTGSKPAFIVATECSVENNSTASSIHTVVWKLDGKVKKVEEGEYGALLDKTVKAGENATTVAGEKLRLDITDWSNISYVKARFVKIDGTPSDLLTGETYRIYIPAGTLCRIDNPEIKNQDIEVNIIGETFVPKYKEKETAEVTVEYNKTRKAVISAVKGERVTLTVAEDGWKVDKLIRFNGEEAFDVTTYVLNGKYISSGLTDKTRFEATLSYDGEIAFEDINGIASLRQFDIRVFSDNGDIVIDGLSGNETVTLFTLSGLKTASRTTPDGGSSMRISAPAGQYIVRIEKNGIAKATNIIH